MFVGKLVELKGNEVVTASVSDPLAEVARILTARRIGAVLVEEAPGNVVGILSERDIVRRVAREGASCLDLTAEAVMVRDLICCAPDDTLEEIMVLMTEHRIRHLPVMDDGVLRGIISIGDAVKARIAEIETERAALSDYIRSG